MATDAVSVTPRVLLLFTCLLFALGGEAVIEPVEVKDVAILPGTLLYAGETATLYCIITGSGHPVPTVTWSRQADALPAGAEADGSAASLTLRNVVADDSGVYVCTADNHVGRPATGNISIVVCPDLPDPETCGDSNPSCLGWAKLGECESNPGWMHPNCKLSCGICIPGLPLECINRGRGRALDTWECNDVTNVPDGVRNSLSLDNFYQKYLHAYGIPILGSSILPDDALRRACYDVLFLLADRKDVRDSYYNYYGRAAIMDDTEVTLDIPEHSDLDAAFNTRARGLGGTAARPVSTGAEENVLCFSNDSYRVEDIFIHEFAHGLDILGARKVVSDFETRLQTAYDDALANGLWANTYADDTRDEYWAEGVQSFFNVNHERDPPDGIHNHVNTRTELQAYDPDLYAIIEDIFPCGNFPVKRCVRDYASYTLKMDCFSENHQRLTVVGNAVWGDAFTTTPASQGTTLTPAASTPTVSQTPTVSRTPAVSTPTTRTASIAPQSTVSLAQSSTVTTPTPTQSSTVTTPTQSSTVTTVTPTPTVTSRATTTTPAQSTGTTPTVGQTPSVSTSSVSTPIIVSTPTVSTSRSTTRITSTEAQSTSGTTPTVGQTPTSSLSTPTVLPSRSTTRMASTASQSTSGTTPTVGQTPSVSTPIVSTLTVLTSRGTTRVASTMVQSSAGSTPSVAQESTSTATTLTLGSSSSAGTSTAQSSGTGAGRTTPTAGRSTAGASSVTPLPSTTMSRAPLASTSTAHAGTTSTVSSATSTAVPSTTTGAAVTPAITATTTNPTGCFQTFCCQMPGDEIKSTTNCLSNACHHHKCMSSPCLFNYDYHKSNRLPPEFLLPNGDEIKSSITMPVKCKKYFLLQRCMMPLSVCKRVPVTWAEACQTMLHPFFFRAMRTH
ncbi:uncharacterized protein LOC144909575 isoform X2 [Branchiostoma floridae x Branchiostoma belcheri]